MITPIINDTIERQKPFLRKHCVLEGESDEQLISVI
jgi:hypothetical protein